MRCYCISNRHSHVSVIENPKISKNCLQNWFNKNITKHNSLVLYQYYHLVLSSLWIKFHIWSPLLFTFTTLEIKALIILLFNWDSTKLSTFYPSYKLSIIITNKTKSKIIVKFKQATRYEYLSVNVNTYLLKNIDLCREPFLNFITRKQTYKQRSLVFPKESQTNFVWHCRTT